MNIYLLQHLLRQTALKFPDNKAVIFKNKSISYSDLETGSSQLALALLRHGVRKNDRIGIILNKSIKSIIAIFGILKAGAAYVPIDPLSPANRIKQIIQNCGIECLITAAKNMTAFFSENDPDFPVKKFFITEGTSIIPEDTTLKMISWEKILNERAEKYHCIESLDVNPAYILHTSGSTGTPKGVVISHLNALTFVHMASAFFEISEFDRIGSHAPLHFDLSVFDIFGAIKSGAAIVLVPEFLSTFPIKLAEYIDQECISIWNSVASVLAMLADRGRLDRFNFNALRLVHFSGDLMPVKYLRILKKHMKKAAFYNIYGQTEANSSLFYPIQEIPDNEAWKIPIGKPFPNFEVFALNKDNKVVSSPGGEGELFVHSSTVALGYWQDEVRTNDRFVPDQRKRFHFSRTFKTGDLVRLDKDGNYVFAGRKDHMVKSRGYRIELDEIEIVINSHPSIKQAVVIAVPDELIGNRIIAYVSLIEGQVLEKNEILLYCSHRLPKYMLPEIVELCASLPTTSSGKIDRKALRNEILNTIKNRDLSAARTASCVSKRSCKQA